MKQQNVEVTKMTVLGKGVMSTNGSITCQEMNMQMLHLHGARTQHLAVRAQGTAGDSRAGSAPTASLAQALREHQRMTAGATGSKPTLEGVVGLLGQGEVLLTEQVHGLVLADLHAGAHVAVPMQEEGERAGQVLTAKATAENKSEV